MGRLFIATGLGVSRVNEVSGQVTTAGSSVTGNLNYIANDVAVDGPAVFTADNSFGSEILYRGINPDGQSTLGRGTCDTPPVQSNAVSPCNGNASYSEADLTLPGKGVPLVFVRSFNAQDSRAGPLGSGWTHSLDMAITVNPFGTVVMVRQGDGRRDKYVKNADGSYTGQAGIYDTLVKNGDNTYTLTGKDQTRFNFSTAGRLTNIVDRNNNTITPTYDVDSKITSITDTSGRVVNLAYNAQNKISTLTDNTSRTWIYAYNAGGRLQSVTNPLGGANSYSYDSAGRMLSVTDARGNAQIQNVYSSLGVLTQQKDAANNVTSYSLGFNPFQFTSTDRRGKITTYVMDDLGRTKEIKDPLGNKRTFTYSGDSPHKASMTDRRGNTSSYTWDSRGNLLTVTDPLGKTTSVTYNADNWS